MVTVQPTIAWPSPRTVGNGDGSRPRRGIPTPKSRIGRVAGGWPQTRIISDDDSNAIVDTSFGFEMVGFGLQAEIASRVKGDGKPHLTLCAVAKLP
jgi:hypothetical protein